MAGDKLVCVGQILGAHGIRGLVKLASYTADPADVVAYGLLQDEAGKRKWRVQLQGQVKQHFIAQFQGIDTREAVEALIGTKLYVARDKLPPAEEGEYYYADLTGLAVRNPAGAALGVVASVQNYGAGDILEVRLAAGGSALYPFNDETVPEVNVAAGYLVLVPPDMVEAEGDSDE